LGTVIMIDIVLSGDNAIVIGSAAAGLAANLRRQAIVIGLVGAPVLRIAFASITFQLPHPRPRSSWWTALSLGGR
jgi:predicted tellurium resistance membrane protein TerC